MLHEKLDNLIAEATKAKNHLRLEALRAIKNEFIKFEKSGSNKVLTEAEENKIILKMISASKDAIEQFKLGKREDLVEEESAQLVIFEEFVPKQHTEKEMIEKTKLIIAEYCEEKGENYKLSMKDMKPILEMVKEICFDINGKIVSSVLRENII